MKQSTGIRMEHATLKQIRSYYGTLLKAYGAQNWWPGHSRFEVIAGAYLTQNTAWRNVERALRELRQAGKLSMKGVDETPLAELGRLIRSAGYFRQKARRLKLFVAHVNRRHRGSLRWLLTRHSRELTQALRQELLELNGVGRETADSILLYAGNHEVFVVDAYTQRILGRHGLIPAKADYEEVRAMVEAALTQSKLHRARNKGLGHEVSRMSRMPRSILAQRFNEMHGLLVQAGKQHCHKKKPQCEECPLEKFLPNRASRRLPER
jgi:endonuclease-3 related protein